MKRKYVTAICLVICVILVASALAGCTDDNETDGNKYGSWETNGSIWMGVGKVKLTFLAEGKWKLNVSGIPGEGDWLTGTYSFEGVPGESTLIMTADESPNCFLSGADSGEQVRIEPSDGKYEISFDLPSAKGTELVLIPPSELPV